MRKGYRLILEESGRRSSAETRVASIRKTNFQAFSSFCSTRKGQSNMIYQTCERPEVSEVKRANSLFICADAVAEELKENKQQPFESKSSMCPAAAYVRSIESSQIHSPLFSTTNLFLQVTTHVFELITISLYRKVRFMNTKY